MVDVGVDYLQLPIDSVAGISERKRWDEGEKGERINFYNPFPCLTKRPLNIKLKKNIILKDSIFIFFENKVVFSSLALANFTSISFLAVH